MNSQHHHHNPHLSRPALGANQSPAQWVPSLFTEGKAAGALRWLPTPSSTEVKERVELYLYSRSGVSWPVTGRLLPLLRIINTYFSLYFNIKPGDGPLDRNMQHVYTTHCFTINDRCVRQCSYCWAVTYRKQRHIIHQNLFSSCWLDSAGWGTGPSTHIHIYTYTLF